MYNPSEANLAAGEQDVDNDRFEYIEIQNVGTQTLDISDLEFTNGVDFQFEDSNVTSLAAGDYAVVVRDTPAFQSRYGAGINIAGEFLNDSRLGNGGERIRLASSIGQVYHDFNYRDGWYPQTDGGGFSLTIQNPAGELGAWDTASGWRASQSQNGSPGTTDSGLIPGTIVINELLSHTDAPGGDWIEILNTSNSAVDISGWFVSDDPSDLDKYQIAAGTVIAADDYFVLTQEANFGNAADPNSRVTFGFSELGDEAIVTSLDPLTGAPGGYRWEVDFAAADKETTFGRVINTAGYVDFVSMRAATLGATNDQPIVPEIVINEIMYNPAEPGTSDDEYIELFNASDSTVPLFDESRPANIWRFTNGVEYDFPENTTLASGEHILVVAVEPDQFRAKHSNLPAGVRVFGPYSGNLSNGGEVLELSRPGEPDPGSETIPYIVSERVRYNDRLPWPFTADGQGPSLSRVASSEWGNEPTHWSAGTHGGTPGRSNLFTDSTPPTVPRNVQLSVADNGLLQINWSPSVDFGEWYRQLSAIPRWASHRYNVADVHCRRDSHI